MMNFYTKNLETKNLRPKKETIQFLLDYSKSVEIVRTKTNYFITLHLN